MDKRTYIIFLLFFMFLAAAAATGYLFWELKNKPAPIPIPPDIAQAMQTLPDKPENSERIDLYYLSPDHSQLIKDTRLILRSSTIPDRIRKALEELLKINKAPSNLISPIPNGAKIQSVFWSELDGRAYISFSRELIDNNPGHALSEWATIYSIVNTVAAQSAAIKEVQLLVDGEIIVSSKMNWDWSLPYRPDSTFVHYTTGFPQD